MVGADVLRDSTSLPCHHIGASDLVQELRFPVVDVPHDRDHRGSGQEVPRAINRFLLDLFSGVLGLPNSREVELLQKQLDLVEVQALIDGDHQPHVLEGGPDDLGGGDVDELGRARPPSGTR